MSFRISNILDYDYFIALDIGSFKVKALVCRIEGQKLNIVGNASLRQSKKDMIDGEIADIQAISNSVQKCITKACQGLDSIPKDIIVSINSSELVYDFTSINYVRKITNEPIKMKEIDHMVEDVELRSIDKIKTKSELRLGIIDAEMKLITTSITGIYIDGNRISNPIGFTGKNIKFNVINIYSPVTRFNVIKNIIRDLELNLISIIPSVICIPKLIDESPQVMDSNVFIDIGYSKISIILQNNSEIIGFNTLNFGYSTLEHELKHETKKGYLDVEKTLNNIDSEYKKYKDIIDNFFNFIFDAFLVGIEDIEKSFYIKNVFLSGGPVSDVLKQKLKKYLEDSHAGKNIDIIDSYVIDEDLKKFGKNDNLSVLSLAKAGKELMAIKKDPLVRILRYVIYKYE